MITLGQFWMQIVTETQGDESFSLMNDILGVLVGTAHAQEAWQDQITFTLAWGEYTEIKATMEEGASLLYEWSSEAGGSISTFMPMRMVRT